MKENKEIVGAFDGLLKDGTGVDVKSPEQIARAKKELQRFMNTRRNGYTEETAPLAYGSRIKTVVAEKNAGKENREYVLISYKNAAKKGYRIVKWATIEDIKLFKEAKKHD